MRFESKRSNDRDEEQGVKFRGHGKKAVTSKNKGMACAAQLYLSAGVFGTRREGQPRRSGVLKYKD